MTQSVPVIMMLGSEGGSPVEQLMAGARRAAARDAIQQLARQPQAGPIYVLTSEREWAEASRDLPAEFEIDPPGEIFHFGRWLARAVERRNLKRVLYLGAASLPLLPDEMLAEALQEVAQAGGPAAVTNNLHSSDWMAVAETRALTGLADRLEKDNALGWVLRTEGGYAVRGLPACAATRLDIDTPTDLLVLSRHPGLKPALQAYLSAASLDTARLRAAARKLATPGSHVALIGRVAAAVWAHVEAHTQVWLRVFSEERGMAASGRQSAGQVRSLIAAHLAAVGERRFFEELSEMAEAVFFDSRVILAHHRRWPPASDRYASDLGQAAAIADRVLRRLTEAALAAPMPVVLGGHGIVSGGMYALIEALGADSDPRFH